MSIHISKCRICTDPNQIKKEIKKEKIETERQIFYANKQSQKLKEERKMKTKKKEKKKKRNFQTWKI